MSIDYLPGLEVGKIDLSLLERGKKKPGLELRPELYLESLNNQLSRLAFEANKDLPGFLGPDACITLIGPDAASDQNLVLSQEEGFSRGEGRGTREWRESREKNPANLAEMALAVMLNKFLGNEYLVARASKYDDYNNGVDLVVIDKKTGAVICGFDEVLGNQGDDGGQKKAEKTKLIMAKGGAQLKYGAELANGELVRAAVKNIPTFYLSLSKEELAGLLTDLKDRPREISPLEEKIFNKFIASLTEQASYNQEQRNKLELIIEKLRRPEAKLAA